MAAGSEEEEEEDSCAGPTEVGGTERTSSAPGLGGAEACRRGACWRRICEPAAPLSPCWANGACER